MKDLLIIDGYNFIFNFFKAGKLDNDDIEYYRGKLTADLIAYNSQKDHDLILAFDASKRGKQIRSSEMIDHIKVIYSREGETADTIIEELVSEWSDYRKIFVVTSDYSQQKVIFGKNTVRRSCREFGLELASARGDIMKRVKKENKNTKRAFYPLEKRLDPEMRKRISDYRKS